MIIIGLDPGCKTGWAICCEGKIVESGVQTFDLGRGESPGMRFLRFRRWLREICPGAHTRVTVLAYERAHHRGGAATEIGVGLCTRIQEFAAEQECESLPVHTATLKKWACSNGRASKPDMIAAARRKLGIGDAPITEDQADAILVALWAWDQVGKIQPPAQAALA